MHCEEPAWLALPHLLLRCGSIITDTVYMYYAEPV
jgi:hypothetical protein